jgi:hypothetical protein
MNFSMPEPIFMKLGMYVMAPKIISTVYVISPPPSVCVSEFTSFSSLLVEGSVKYMPPFVARQQLGKDFPQQRRITGGVVSYAIRIV